MKQTPLENQLTAQLTPIVDALGFTLLWLEMKSGVLSVFCENPQTGRITLDECSAVSREISRVLEETDPIAGAYTLEVGSAGIDRPLFTEADYMRFVGLEVKIEIDDALDEQSGQRRFRGIIDGAQDGVANLDCPDIGKVSLPLDRITKARLVMSDELIKATKPKAVKEVTA